MDLITPILALVTGIVLVGIILDLIAYAQGLIKSFTDYLTRRRKKRQSR